MQIFLFTLFPCLFFYRFHIFFLFLALSISLFFFLSFFHNFLFFDPFSHRFFCLTLSFLFFSVFFSCSFLYFLKQFALFQFIPEQISLSSYNFIFFISFSVISSKLLSLLTIVIIFFNIVIINLHMCPAVFFYVCTMHMHYICKQNLSHIENLPNPFPLCYEHC